MSYNLRLNQPGTNDTETEVLTMKKWTRLLLLILLLAGLCCAAVAEELKPGDSGDAVLELNTRLRQLNYSTTRATDQYSASTEAAVKAVQTAYGLEVTGVADDATLNVIYGDCYRPLSKGDTGEDVRQLQERLVELGYYYGNITGNYLDGTVAAVITLQGETGLTVTGTADVATQEKLFSLAVRPTPTPTPIPTPGPVPTPSPTPGPYQAFTKTLKYGSTGSDVQKVQQRLMDLGFFTYKKTTTGFYKNTQTAVEAFQKHNSLKVTGVVDEDTWNALFNDPSVATVSDAAKPAFEPTPVPYFFEVDVANQAVKVWKYNRETKDYTDLDRCFICATGTTKYPSPLGTFTLSGRKAAHCKFPTWGGGEARWWTKITDEIAFHSVLYSDSSNDATLNVSSFNGLGRRGSHGCIRMTVADAKWIYDHVAAGMKVWIHDDAPNDPELKALVKPGALNKKTMMPYVTPAPPAYYYDPMTVPTEALNGGMEKGDQGEAVYWLQSALRELGYYQGTVTGQYQDGTKKAVAEYQRSRGLRTNSTVDKEMVTMLGQDVRSLHATPTPPAPTPTEAQWTPSPESPSPTPSAE